MKRALALGLALVLVGACSDDDDGDGTTTTPTTAAPVEPTTTPTTAEEPTTTTTVAEPAGDPVDAAEAFLVTFFPGDAPTLAPFQQGDAQSGEIEVFRPREGGGVGPLASTLLLRVVDGEWQVIGAVNPNVTIDSPENGAEVDAGPLTIAGVGRGFEAHLGIHLYELDGTEVATAIASGGSAAEPLPYEAEVDLSGLAPGTELVVVVRGGTGLDRDTGEFSAIRITT